MSKEMRKYIDTFKQRLTESENLNISDVSDSELFTLQDTPRQKFVSEMQSIIFKLDAIDKETPWQHVEPEWWLEMMDIRKKAFDAVQKFKK